MNTESTTFTFLGTGTSQGVPVIGCGCEVCSSGDIRDNRLRSAGLISKGNNHLVIDVGPDFRQQILRTGISSIDGILITHEHNDHVIGLDEVRPFNFMTRRSMNVYGEERVLEELRTRFSYIFHSNPYPGAPKVNLLSIKAGAHFEVGPFSVESMRIDHGNLPILGFRVGGFAYCTDTKQLPQPTFDRLRGIDTLVISALHRRRHHSHLNLEESLTLISDLSPRRAYLTHCSHSMGLYKEVQQLLPKNVFLAYDGLKITLPV